jgi:hypothetical protein
MARLRRIHTYHAVPMLVPCRSPAVLQPYSHIRYRSHAVPLPFYSTIHTYHAVPLPFYSPIHTYHAVPLLFPCRFKARFTHTMPRPCHYPAILRQCCVLRESPCGRRKHPNCLFYGLTDHLYCGVLLPLFTVVVMDRCEEDVIIA